MCGVFTEVLRVLVGGESGQPAKHPTRGGRGASSPSCHFLFASGLHRAQSAVKARSREDEKGFRFLGRCLSTPDRVLYVHEEEIFALESREPNGVEVMTRAAQQIKPFVWRGDRRLF